MKIQKINSIEIAAKIGKLGGEKGNKNMKEFLNKLLNFKVFGEVNPLENIIMMLFIEIPIIILCTALIKNLMNII